MLPLNPTEGRIGPFTPGDHQPFSVYLSCGTILRSAFFDFFVVPKKWRDLVTKAYQLAVNSQVWIIPRLVVQVSGSKSSPLCFMERVKHRNSLNWSSSWVESSISCLKVNHQLRPRNSSRWSGKGLKLKINCFLSSIPSPRERANQLLVRRTVWELLSTCRELGPGTRRRHFAHLVGLPPSQYLGIRTFSRHWIVVACGRIVISGLAIGSSVCGVIIILNSCEPVQRAF